MPPGDRVASHVLPEGRGPRVTVAVVGDEAATTDVGREGGLLGLDMGVAITFDGISNDDRAEGVPRVPSANTDIAVTWY